MDTPSALGLIAGSGVYPKLLAQAARRAGVSRLVAVAFNGETDPGLTSLVDEVEWLRVGQLGRMLHYFKSAGLEHAIMAGQIAPKNLFDFRPDVKALVVLARLKQRNAESIFGAIADELARINVQLLPATTFLEDCLAATGIIAGRALGRHEQSDVEFGIRMAKEISRLDIGQTVVVKGGTVLAVEAFEGTNEALRRGAALARKGATMAKVSKPNQDMRFDVPVIGVETIRIAAEANVRVIAVEAGRTLLLEKESVCAAAKHAGITLVGC